MEHFEELLDNVDIPKGFVFTLPFFETALEAEIRWNSGPIFQATNEPIS